MAEMMRDRLVYSVFHSTDEDAVDLLMATFVKAYPEADEAKIADVRKTAEEGVNTAREAHAWFAISPSGRIETVSPVDIVVGWEEFGGGDILAEVLAALEQQVANGETPESDDEKGGDHLLTLAQVYLSGFGQEGRSAQEVRMQVIAAMAVLMRTVEFIDRAQERHIAGLVDEAIPDEPVDHGGWEDH